MLSPELEEWQDKKNLVFDLNRAEIKMEELGIEMENRLPNLQKRSQETIKKLEDWTEEAMNKLEISQINHLPEQTVTEKAQEIVDAISQAATPTEPSESR